MSTKAVQRRRGTTEENAAFTGLVGEVSIDTDKKTAVVHDGETAGGYPLAREDLTNAPAFLGDTGIGGAKGLVPAPSSGDATKVLYGNGTWADLPPAVASVSLQNMVFVALNGDDMLGDGSLAKPYATIQQAVNAAVSGQTIMISPGVYAENVEVSSKSLTLRGSDAFMQIITRLEGKVTILSNASISFANLSVHNDNDYCLYMNDAGQCRFDFSTFTRTNATDTAIRIVGNTSTAKIIFTRSYVEGVIELSSTIQQPVVVNGMMSALASFKLLGINPLTIEDSNEIGKVIHENGVLALRNIGRVTAAGVGLTSIAANLATNGLVISSVNFQQSDGSYATIDKSGDCVFSVSNSNRDVANDQLVGTRISFASTARDIAALHPAVNYTAVDGTVEGHFSGIDAALATKTENTSLAAVATSGDYADLINTPIPFSGLFADLSDKPTLGSAAALDAGLNPGNVPVLDVTGKLNANTIPSGIAGVSNLASLADVDLTGAQPGYVLTFTGTKWIAAAPSGYTPPPADLDGGNFTSEPTTTVDGGNFTDSVVTDFIDGGVFASVVDGGLITTTTFEASIDGGLITDNAPTANDIDGGNF